MKEELSIDIIGLAGAYSYALDCIEAELVNIKNKHGKRVAYISICMAEYWKIQGDELQDLAMCALLHDNALTQYISEELKKDSVINCKKDLSEKKTNLHCIYGEKNITKIPFKTDVSNVILYHHEHADGTGPFQKKWNEIPLFARIIHLADTIDIIGNNTGSGNNSWNFICQYLLKNRDGLFDSECVNAFFHAFPHSESFICLSDNSFEMKLWEIIPRQKQVFDWKTCKNVADFFAKIVDYKSSFTSRHSIGVAEKAAFFAQYIGYDSINVQKIYLAGALHDIGKMAVGNEILEKPDKLTDDEFSKMKNHAGYTYLIGNNSWNFICQYLLKNRDGLFDSECVNAFFHAFPHSESFICLSDNSFEMKLWEIIPRQKQVFDWKTCKNVADFFAKIVDYKSSFTSRHSIGVAEKASMLAQYMGYDSIAVQKMYLAGALHDIGKMAVGNEILEKPDKLTDDEFSKMKNHAGYTYLILSEVNDFEEIRDWAAFHHEKLNGKGYPFGKTAAELNEPERIMACIDIYQALTEDRPYKKGLSHEKTCEMLDDMAQKGFVDSDISKKIRECFGGIY